VIMHIATAVLHILGYIYLELVSARMRLPTHSRIVVKAASTKPFFSLCCIWPRTHNTYVNWRGVCGREVT
jgi:hypothetical protein